MNNKFLLGALMILAAPALSASNVNRENNFSQQKSFDEKEHFLNSEAACKESESQGSVVVFLNKLFTDEQVQKLSNNLNDLVKANPIFASSLVVSGTIFLCFLFYLSVNVVKWIITAPFKLIGIIFGVGRGRGREVVYVAVPPQQIEASRVRYQ